MRAIIHQPAPLLLSLSLCGLRALAQEGYVTLEGRQFMLNGEPFYPVVMNYTVELVSSAYQSTDTSGLYFSVASHYDANVYSYYECNGEASCTQQLQAHFAKLISMGFNTIRLICPVYMSEEGPGGEKKYRIELRHNDGDWPVPYAGYLDLPDFSGPLAEWYFGTLRRVISLADQAGLKTILLCAEDYKVDDGNPNNGEPWYQLTLAESDPAVELYKSYLARLAFELREERGLLAYDLWNEPNWTADHLTALTKAQVCDYTERWYDAIHQAAPHHLVTLGGSGFHEISSWDPAVMKLDFYSPHHYPAPEVVFDYDNDLANEALKAQFYWLGADCPMPWLIGETGFIAEDDAVDPLDALNNCNGQHLRPDPVYHDMPFMGGSEAEQAEFAALSLSAVRAYRGSGYSWWDFQNGRFSWLLVQNSFPNNPEMWLQGNFFGLLKFGNHVPILPQNVSCALPEWDTVNAWRDKPAVQVFEDYDPGEAPTELPPPPPNYSSWYNTSGEVHTQYTIVDEGTGEPIPHALGTVEWFYRTTDPWDDHDKGATLWDRNTTDASGHVSIRKRQPANTMVYEAPEPKRLFIDAFGADHRAFDTDNGPPWPNDGDNISISQNRLFMENELIGLTIPIGNSEVHKAWSSLTLVNVLVQGDDFTGGIADFKARDIVHAQGEFHAQRGSEVHLHTDTAFIPCGEAIAGMTTDGISGRSSSSLAVQEDGKRLHLKFTQPKVVVRVFPNPCTIGLQVELDDGIGQCTVANAAGVTVYKSATSSAVHTLSVTAWAAGDYTVHVTTGDGDFITTITKL